MKNTLILFSIIAAALASCNKDDVEPANEKYRLKEANYSSAGDYTKYEYDSQGRLVKYLSNNYSVLYTYDSQGKLIRMEQNRPLDYEYYNEQYTYSVDGNIEEMLVRYKDLRYPTENRYRTSYKFNGSKLTESALYYWVPATQSWTDGGTTRYDYNTEGRLLKTNRGNDYMIYSYDNNGNRVEIKYFLLKTGSSNQYYLERTVTYTYDNKKNIYENLYPNPIKSFGSSPNNYLDIVSKDFDESGATTNLNTNTFTYEYNPAGYPIKVSYNNGNSTTYILEKY